MYHLWSEPYSVSRVTHAIILLMLAGGVANLLTCQMMRTHSLHQAAASGDLSLVQNKLSEDVNVDQRDAAGRTALMVAAENGRLQIVNLLLSKGADLNAHDNRFGSTAVMLAAYSGHEDIVEILIHNGADVNAARSDGVTALMLASMQGNLGIVRAFLRQGARVNATDYEGRTAVRIARYRGHIDVARELESAGGLE